MTTPKFEPDPEFKELAVFTLDSSPYFLLHSESEGGGGGGGHRRQYPPPYTQTYVNVNQRLGKPCLAGSPVLTNQPLPSEEASSVHSQRVRRMGVPPPSKTMLPPQPSATNTSFTHRLLICPALETKEKLHSCGTRDPTA